MGLSKILVNKAPTRVRIDLLDLVEFFIFESHELLNLDALNTDLLDQLSKHTYDKLLISFWRDNRYSLPGSDSIVHHFCDIF